jgi:hypothetical protein
MRLESQGIGWKSQAMWKQKSVGFQKPDKGNTQGKNLKSSFAIMHR